MKLIDGDILLENIHFQDGINKDGVIYVKLGDVWKSIINQSEAIVRCKDCKRYKWEATRCLAFNAPMREDGFCSHGKRRTDDQ